MYNVKIEMVRKTYSGNFTTHATELDKDAKSIKLLTKEELLPSVLHYFGIEEDSFKKNFDGKLLTISNVNKLSPSGGVYKIVVTDEQGKTVPLFD